MERPSIVFSVNNGFISYLIVALRTLGRNNDYPIDIYIIHSDLSIENLNLLERTKLRFLKISNLFIELINLFMTVPSIFKINSLSIDNFNELLNSKIRIETISNEQTIDRYGENTFLFEIMKIIYIDYTNLEIENAKKYNILTEKLVEAIEKNKTFNENAKKIFEKLASNEEYNNIFFFHIKNFTYILKYYIDNIDILFTKDVNTVNIVNWFFNSIINISNNLNNAIDNIEILERSNNKKTFKDELDNIIIQDNNCNSYNDDSSFLHNKKYIFKNYNSDVGLYNI
jgi:hypothetical protein